MANAQTEATKKYKAKKGIISKSFVTNRETADQFKKACEAAGVSQSAAINAFMKEFIEKYSPNEEVGK